MLAAESVSLFKYALAASMVFAIQAVELRAHASRGDFLGSGVLGEHTAALYDAFYAVIGRTPSAKRPLVEKNYEVSLDSLVNAVFRDLEAPSSKLFSAIAGHRLGQGFL